MITNLESVIGRIHDELTRKNEVRDLTLSRSRALIRFCANSIRATHRHEYDVARQLLDEARAAAKIMCDDVIAPDTGRSYADVYYAGYLQDAMKELAEAAITLALVTGEQIPDPDDAAAFGGAGIEYAAYLNGMAEAMGEMRRFALDSIRRGDTSEAERLLEIMDEVYSQLVTIDFPDSLTRGLRRTTDMVRGVTERTRGDLTTAVRQEKLQAALQAFEERLNSRIGDDAEKC